MMTFLNNLGVAAILSSLKLVAKGMDGKNTPESPRLEFLKRFQQKPLPYQRQKTKPQYLINRGGIADLTLFSILRNLKSLFF